MSRFNKGWVAIDRRIFLADKQANDFFGDMPLAVVWILLISWANVRDGKARPGKDQRVVPRGSLITSQGEIGDQLGITRQTVRRCLAYLTETQRINLVSNRAGLFITVLNYEKYQNPDPVDNQASNPQATNEQPTSNQRATHEQPPIEQSNNRTREQRNKVAAGVRPPTAPGMETKSGPTWSAYRSAYVMLHGAEPLPNKTALSMCCRLVDLVGRDDAPEVAEWFVSRERESWIYKSRHPLGQLVKNWQKYHTDWKTQTKVTETKAKSVERDDSNQDAIDRYLARKHAPQPITGA
jgi:hypothetical protein